MTRRPRRNHTPAFKAKVAMAAIKGDKTIAQLAEQFDVHANQITTWKDQLQQGAADVFGPGGGGTAPGHGRTTFHSCLRRSAPSRKPIPPSTAPLSSPPQIGRAHV